MAEFKKQIANLTQLVLSMQSKIGLLHRHIKDLFVRIANLPVISKVRAGKKNPQQSTQRCFKCNRTGHFARDCRSARQLNQMGYQDWQINDRISVAENFQNGQSKNIQNDEVSEVCPSFNDDLYQQPGDFATINSLLVRNSNQQKINKILSTKKEKSYPTDVIQDFNFIEGKCQTNSYGKSYSKVLQNSMSVMPYVGKKSVYSNRPVLHGRVNDRMAKIFIDTGSEVNVINENLLFQILGKNVTVKNVGNKNVSCANGSKLDIKGSITLRIQIGLSEKLLQFLVCTSIFPQVILGIHGMQSLGMNIDLKNSEIITKGVRVPFIGKIDTESVILKKNSTFLLNRTGVQDKVQA